MSDVFGSLGDVGRLSIGAALRFARLRAGLTGADLANRAGMSQAKVSRLETGKSPADPADVRTLAQAMGLPADEAEALESLATQTYERMTDWRAEPRGLPQRQDEVGQLERQSAEIRVFNPSVIPGLLQTSSYARAVITTLASMLAPESAGQDAGKNLVTTVSRRMSRQEILASATKRFHFVITESVLGAGVGTPEDMIGQLQQIRYLTGLPNVSLKILPARSFVTVAPMHSFELLDRRAVIIDLFNTSMTAQSRSDIRLYHDLFERFDLAATADVDALLDEYTEYYRHQAAV
ncbi:helix-turn-helix domain-containing protein [Actinoplanes palleronii]|uniref:Transcriptional regulator n=1 Tax=Actinoplanes palleronii TaxID=113570 RepID=A0ABQ4BB48_9ACTN|nr:helix-turn-helix transcriptional regulator [Actinoplanes palleronii]GIE67859.1 transcriptional regulator [Actinoplanes palleronii]